MMPYAEQAVAEWELRVGQDGRTDSSQAAQMLLDSAGNSRSRSADLAQGQKPVPDRGSQRAPCSPVRRAHRYLDNERSEARIGRHQGWRVQDRVREGRADTQRLADPGCSLRSRRWEDVLCGLGLARRRGRAVLASDALLRLCSAEALRGRLARVRRQVCRIRFYRHLRSLLQVDGVKFGLPQGRPPDGTPSGAGGGAWRAVRV